MRRFLPWFVAVGVGLVLDTVVALPLVGQQPTRDHYTPSFGLSGAGTLDAPRTNATTTYEQRPGWNAGAWFNLPLGLGISVEPQLHYWSMSSRHTVIAQRSAQQRNAPRPLLDNATTGFLSAPLLLKVHLGRVAALTVGGQADVALHVNDTPNYWTTDSITTMSLSGTGGIELFPHGRLAFFGRYTFGVSNLRTGTIIATDPSVQLQGAQVGVKWRLLGTRVRADSDGDGLLDALDKCPREKGAVKDNGCLPADTDKDGIRDTDDACPTTAGPAEHRGCEPPVVLDLDKDGVPDASDRCPNSAGSAALGGCADSDSDGLEDAMDRCPQAAGVAGLRGCPRLLGYRASDVTFEPGTAKLTAAGRGELDKVTAYLKMYPAMSVEFVGHTSNSVPLDVGIGLSVRRAEAARDFINLQGIALERMTVRGEGGRRPTTSNSTIEGRMLNNRVEAILR
jgi:outer membrane protein OmpA-like peptidoglycan-associated protein